MVMKSELTDSARKMRKLPTEAERIMWGLLRGSQLDGMKFRRQTPIGPYIADFVCFDAKLIVECDGGQHADSTHDSRRDAWLRSQGFTILRFWNGEVIENTLGVTATILRDRPK
jgi:very-short-patch-repair endonuclease